jgi:hypothetical protein
MSSAFHTLAFRKLLSPVSPIPIAAGTTVVVLAYVAFLQLHERPSLPSVLEQPVVPATLAPLQPGLISVGELASCGQMNMIAKPFPADSADGYLGNLPLSVVDAALFKLLEAVDSQFDRSWAVTARTFLCASAFTRVNIVTCEQLPICKSLTSVWKYGDGASDYVEAIVAETESLVLMAPEVNETVARRIAAWVEGILVEVSEERIVISDLHRTKTGDCAGQSTVSTMTPGISRFLHVFCTVLACI